VRFGDPSSVAERLTSLAARCDGRLIALLAAHATAAAAADGRALDVVGRDFESLGLLLFAAEASAAAGRAHARTGRRSSSFAARERALDLVQRCGVARTPALTWADQPIELTRREREVADLAAAAMTSRDIADRLGVTIRTVDNLLGRVYSKLGLSGRQELIDVVGRRARE
jgi:DNA-binding CsgD family transcriptional regulator